MRERAFSAGAASILDQMERGGRQKSRTAPVAGAGVSINKRGCWIATGDMRKGAGVGVIAGTERQACPI